MLSASDAGRIGRLVLPKKCAESFDDILEPKLDELIAQLKEIDGLRNYWLIDHLTRRLSTLSAPDDLFNFVSDLRGILGGPNSGIMEDDQIILDPNSNLGVFLRRCILAFNLLSFEGVCHPLNNIGAYCKEFLSSCSPYELPHAGSSKNDSEGMLEYENMDLENFVFEKVNEEMEARKRASGRIPFHTHAPKAYMEWLKDSYGGYMVAFAGRKYAARSPAVFVANSTYTITSFTLVLEFHKGRLQTYIGKGMDAGHAQEIPVLSASTIRIVQSEQATVKMEVAL